MHWADVLARKVAPTAEQHVLATAITPSGPIHVGNLREVLTTEMVARSLREVEDVPARLVYIADSYDHLRKVYPFLKESDYEEHVGRPLAEIPCPCGDHGSYAQHFLEPFFAALDELGVEMEVLDAHRMYASGDYQKQVERSMDQSDRLRVILEETSRRRLPADWIPFNVQCESCKRLPTTRATARHGTQVEYACTCGHAGTVDVSQPGAGKLPWRIDWPARWTFLGVTFEAMGKDHAAAGGSWDTGVRIVEDVFGHKPPVRTVYEFIQLKGKGAMHGSTGTGVSAEDVLAMTPPEVLRFFFARNHPNKHLDFDPGLGILDLVDAYDEWERAFHGTGEVLKGMKDVERTYELSQPHQVPSEMPVQVGYRHLATMVQVARDPARDAEVLARNGWDLDAMTEQGRRRVEARATHVREWLERFAPDSVRFTVQESLPDMELAAEEGAFLAELGSRLRNVDWDGQAIHEAIHSAAKHAGIGGGAAFRVVYRAFLGRPKGPRAGFFLASMDPDFVRGRVDEATQLGTATE